MVGINDLCSFSDLSSPHTENESLCGLNKRVINEL